MGDFEDSLFGLFLLPGDALGVDAEQDVDSVTGPLGDLGWIQAAFDGVLTGSAMRVLRIPSQAPRANSHAERCGGTASRVPRSC